MVYKINAVQKTEIYIKIYLGEYGESRLTKFISETFAILSSKAVYFNPKIRSPTQNNTECSKTRIRSVDHICTIYTWFKLVYISQVCLK